MNSMMPGQPLPKPTFKPGEQVIVRLENMKLIGRFSRLSHDAKGHDLAIVYPEYGMPLTLPLGRIAHIDHRSRMVEAVSIRAHAAKVKLDARKLTAKGAVAAAAVLRYQPEQNNRGELILRKGAR